MHSLDYVMDDPHFPLTASAGSNRVQRTRTCSIWLAACRPAFARPNNRMLLAPKRDDIMCR